MSGGGSDKKKTKAKDEPAIPGTGPMMTQPAFFGDNQNLLAQQLAAGGYGAEPDLMAMLTQMFTPMQILDTRPGATPAAAPIPTPSKPASSRPARSNVDQSGPAHKNHYPQIGQGSNR